MYIDSVLGGITGPFGLRLHVFSALGTCMQIYMHDDEFGCSSQLMWRVFLNQSAHLEALLPSVQMQAGAWGVKMQSWLTLGAVFFFFLQLMVVMELFFMTTADFGVCGSPVCSPEAVVWLLGLGSNGFCDTVPVVVVSMILSEGPPLPHHLHWGIFPVLKSLNVTVLPFSYVLNSIPTIIRP